MNTISKNTEESQSGLYKLPDGWVETNFGSIITRISNGTTNKQNKNKIGIPVSRIETISYGIIDSNKVGYIEKIENNNIEKYRLLYDDILFSHINSDLHLGKTALYRSVPEKLLHGMNLLLIRANQHLIVPIFLHYLCNYYRFDGKFISIAQHAVNQSSINQKALKSVPIPLPPLAEQHRIVEKIEEEFTRLDAGVSALKRAKSLIPKYRQSVLKAAMCGDLTKEWRAANPDVESAEFLVETKPNEIETPSLHELPDNWMWINLGKISKSMKNGIYKPKSFYCDDGFACLRMYNIENGKIVWKKIKRLNISEKEISDYLLEPGDLLVNRVNSRELVGKSAPITTDLEPCIYESKNIRVKFKSELVLTKIVSFWFQIYAQKYFNHNAQQTVGMASINQDQLSQMPIPLPPLEEQHEIVSEIERRFSIIDEMERVVDESLLKAERLRQSVLKKAFEGRLVSQNPDDEPAGVLLERIQAEKELQAKEGKANGKKKSAGKKKIKKKESE